MGVILQDIRLLAFLVVTSKNKFIKNTAFATIIGIMYALLTKLGLIK